MTCIKTGARVLFDNYGVTVSADLYQVGNCCIVRTNPYALCEEKSNSFDATHVFDCNQSDVFFRDDIGIFIVPMSAITACDAPDPLLE